jgi:hypothetical protein
MKEKERKKESRKNQIAVLFLFKSELIYANFASFALCTFLINIEFLCFLSSRV